MILDRENLVASAVALTASSGTGNLVSTDTIDLGVRRDIGIGHPLYFFHQISGANAAGGTSAEFQIIVSANADLSSPTVVASSGAIVSASLVAGFSIFQPIPRVPSFPGQRYIGARVVRVGTFTGNAAWTSGIIIDPSDFGKYYGLGYTIA